MKYVRLQKVRATDHPDTPPGDSATYRYGEQCDTHSLPVEYELQGWLGEDPAVGKCVSILRCQRGGIARLGLFTSSKVARVSQGEFQTRNSIYRYTEIPFETGTAPDESCRTESPTGIPRQSHQP